MAFPSPSSASPTRQPNVPMRRAALRATSVRRTSTKAPNGDAHNVLPTLTGRPKQTKVPAPAPGTVSLPMLRVTQASQGRDNGCKPISLRCAVKLSELMWRLAEVAAEREGPDPGDTGLPYALLDHVSIESFSNIFLYEPTPPPPEPISVTPLPEDVVKLSTILEYMEVMEELQQVYERGLRLKPASERRLRSSPRLFAYPTPAATPAFPQQDTFDANSSSKPIGDLVAVEQVHPSPSTPKRKRGRPKKQPAGEPKHKRAKTTPGKAINRQTSTDLLTEACKETVLLRPFVALPARRQTSNPLPCPTPSLERSQSISIAAPHHAPAQSPRAAIAPSLPSTSSIGKVNAAQGLHARGDEIVSSFLEVHAGGDPDNQSSYHWQPFPPHSATPRQASAPGAGPLSSQPPMLAAWLFANPDDFLANLNAEYHWTPSPTSHVANSMHHAGQSGGHYPLVSRNGYDANSASTPQGLGIGAIPRSMLPRNQPFTNQGPSGKSQFQGSYPQGQASTSNYHHQMGQSMQAAYDAAVLGTQHRPPGYHE